MDDFLVEPRLFTGGPLGGDEDVESFGDDRHERVAEVGVGDPCERHAGDVGAMRDEAEPLPIVVKVSSPMTLRQIW